MFDADLPPFPALNGADVKAVGDANMSGAGVRDEVVSEAASWLEGEGEGEGSEDGGKGKK